MSIALKPAAADDIAAVLTFWRLAAEPTSTDSTEALSGLLHHDAGSLIIAEEDGRIVGSVIAAWDGWRGAIYRLAVAPPHRRRGLGHSLLRAAEDHLVDRGATRMHAIVVGSNANAVAFWNSSHWEHQVEQLRYANG